MRRSVIFNVLACFSFFWVSCATRTDFPHSSTSDFDLASVLKLTRAAEYISRGKALAEEGRYKEALELIKEGIEIYPYNAVGYTLLGQIHFLLSNFEKALRYASLALEKDPASDGANGIMGAILHFGFGEHDRALHYYNLAIRHAPNASDHFFNRGQLHRLTGRNGMALEDFNSAINISPFNDTYRRERGIVLKQLGKFEEALIDFYSLLRMNNNSVETLWLITLAYLFSNRHDETLYTAKRIMRIDPSQYNAYHMVGLILGTRDEFNEAVKWISRAIEINPFFISAYEVRAEIFEVLAETALPPRDAYYRLRALQDEEMALRLRYYQD